MKFDLDKDFSQAKWFKMGTADDDPEFKVRLYPSSRQEMKFYSDGSFSLSGRARKEKFIYCLVDWKRVEDKNGNHIPCTDENKEKFFEHNLGGIPIFVLESAARLEQEVQGDLGNLGNGQGGSSQS